jgi:hypothetical protein
MVSTVAFLWVVCGIFSTIFVVLILNRTSINMKTNRLKYLSLILLAIMMSCQKDNKTISELIIGKWEWVKTIIPYGGQESNPQTSGFSETLEFMRDGKMNEYRNDSLITSSNYKIQTKLSTPNWYVLTNSTIISSDFYMINDSLIFNEAYVDGPVSSYIRKK